MPNCHIFRAMIALVAVLAVPAQAATRPSDQEIRDLVTENARATQAGDLEAVRATMHPESRDQAAISQALQQLQPWKLNFNPVKVDFVGMSGEYALVRVVQETTRVSGPDFMDNRIDSIWALRQYEGKWKYWSQMILRLEPLAPGSGG